MPGGSLLRFLALAGFIVFVALALWLVDVGRPFVVLGVGLAWAIASLYEWLAWRDAQTRWPPPELRTFPGRAGPARVSNPRRAANVAAPTRAPAAFGEPDVAPPPPREAAGVRSRDVEPEPIDAAHVPAEPPPEPDAARAADTERALAEPGRDERPGQPRLESAPAVPGAEDPERDLEREDDGTSREPFPITKGADAPSSPEATPPERSPELEAAQPVTEPPASSEARSADADAAPRRSLLPSFTPPERKLERERSAATPATPQDQPVPPDRPKRRDELEPKEERALESAGEEAIAPPAPAAESRDAAGDDGAADPTETAVATDEKTTATREPAGEGARRIEMPGGGFEPPPEEAPGAVESPHPVRRAPAPTPRPSTTRSLRAVPPPRPSEPAAVAPRSPTPPGPAPPAVPLPERPREPREWNLWDLESLAREAGRRTPARAEEWSYLFLYLRHFATPRGELPREFDGIVRESFGTLLEPLERP